MTRLFHPPISRRNEKSDNFFVCVRVCEYVCCVIWSLMYVLLFCFCFLFVLTTKRRRWRMMKTIVRRWMPSSSSFIGYPGCCALSRISWAFVLHNRWCFASWSPCTDPITSRRLPRPKLKINTIRLANKQKNIEQKTTDLHAHLTSPSQKADAALGRCVTRASSPK